MNFSSICTTLIFLFLASRVVGIDPKLAGIIGANNNLGGQRLLNENQINSVIPSSWHSVPVRSATAATLVAVGGIAIL
ncbi:hypothetical protein C8J56DRAFT_925103 [Mycena floridula]|nr:hypothetical protein C8J56DRAFT_925103 [Mycena floridula]